MLRRVSQALRKSLLFLAVVGSIFAPNAVSYAGDPGRHHKHGRYREWMQLLSEEDRAVSFGSVEDNMAQESS
jgi:hypothetical protein